MRILVPMHVAALLAALTAASCGSSPAAQQPSLPGFDDAGAAPGGASGPAAGGDAAGGPPRPPAWSEPSETAARAGKVIVEADRHLRAWVEAMAQPRDEENQETVTFTASALGRYVKKNQEVLEQQAISGPPRNRGIAAAALGFSGDPAVLPLLANAATDPDPDVASKALLGLGVLAADETPTGPIHTAVTSPGADVFVMRNGAFALLQLAELWRADPDGGVASAGLALLEYPDSKVRAQAALALGLARCNIALPPLTDLLAGDPDPEVRTAAAYALGRIGARGSTGPLVQALRDPHDVTAGTARAALTRIHGEDLGPDPESWDPVRDG